MYGTKTAGKTIGEVEKITGIPKRKLKYFMEQNILKPSQQAENGFWLYSDEDIQRVQLASLCRDLDFPVNAIRNILADPDSCWHEEMERHIIRLTGKRDLAETQLHLAKLLVCRGAWEALQVYCGLLTEKDAVLTAR